VPGTFRGAVLAAAQSPDAAGPPPGKPFQVGLGPVSWAVFRE